MPRDGAIILGTSALYSKIRLVERGPNLGPLYPPIANI